MASTSTPLTLPVLPLDDEVVLPGMVVPLDLSDTEVRAAVEAAQAAAAPRASKPRVLLVPRIDGTYAGIGMLGTRRAGRPAVRRRPRRADPRLRPGADRRRHDRARRRAVGRGHRGRGDRARPAARRGHRAGQGVQGAGHQLAAASAAPGRSSTASSRSTTSPTLADNSGYSPFLTTEQKVELLETADPVARLKLATERLREHLAEQDVAESIAKDVQEGVDKQQREFLLRRQLEAVRKELRRAQRRRRRTRSDDYRARVEAADLPEKVREAALKEVDKLERSSDQSPEGGWIRTWLDTVLELPWNERTEDAYDIPGARAILDADHAGLEDVKERITEYLAVRKRRADRGLGVVGGRRGGAVLALVGPPGVGKTSLGESVARAMGRKFVRVALGGVRDEAEIRGHRRTYVGALPGRIVRAIKEAGSMNPVVLLDEIDKVGSDFRGDPAAALLEVLDPAQNHTFRDHYLEVELDLSRRGLPRHRQRPGGHPRGRCSTGWSWSGSTATPRTRRSSSPATTCCRASWSGPAWSPARSTLDDERAAQAGRASTPARRAYGTWSGPIARLLRKVAAQHELGERELPFTVGAGRPARADRAAAPRARVRAGPGRAAHRGAGRGDRPRGHRRGRRRALRRGVAGRPGDRRRPG